jgi:tetratricopeptide (TPR) repeat protein
LRKGIECFQQAIALDSNYALAYAGLADAYDALGLEEYGALRPLDVMPKAKTAALRALQIDDDLAEAHTSLGRALVFDWDWTRSEKEFRRALELDPNYSEGHRSYAIYLVRSGNLDHAFAEATRAWELEAGSPNRSMVVGWVFYFQRQYDKAIDQYLKTLEIEPEYYPARFRLGLAYLQKGMFKEATSELERAAALSGRNARILAYLGYAYAISGKRVRAEGVLRELTAKSKTDYVSAYDMAVICLGLGQRDEVMRWLEKSIDDRDDWLLMLNVDPIFDGVRADPRFHNLERTVGLAH